MTAPTLPPEVLATRTAAGALAITCPFCCRRHVHGAVPGWRVAHCAGTGPRRSYLLVPIEPRTTP